MSSHLRPRLIALHLGLAAFMLPAALMFLITGGLYTWGIKGGYSDSVHQLALTQPLSADLGALQALARTELAARDLAPPSGTASLKRNGGHFHLEWTGADLDLQLAPTADPRVAELRLRDTSAYRHLVQLHKAKGGTAFKVYAAAFAVSLLLLLLSGLTLAWQLPRYRRLTLGALGAGALGFATALLLS